MQVCVARSVPCHGHSGSNLLHFRRPMRSSFLPCAELRRVLLPAYPCSSFGSTCQEEMRWNPARGHVPRGFCGALGRLSEVQLVLLVAEPGDPHQGESCLADSPEEFLEATCRYTYGCFASGKDRFTGISANASSTSVGLRRSPSRCGARGSPSLFFAQPEKGAVQCPRLSSNAA